MAINKVYNFKSSGKNVSRAKKELQKIESENEILPLGFSLPLDINSSGNGLFKMNVNLEDQLEDNFKTLVLTKPGERLGFPDYGVDLIDVLHGLGQEEIDQIAMDRIKSAVDKYMPFIQLKGFTSNYENTTSNSKVLNIYIIYQINNNSEKTLNLKLDLSN
tara:strand:+ start:34 stop:516 length:483 start_codon:yes stop_codon:yes gene_type:complete